MAEPRFLSEFDPRYGESVAVAPGIERVVAHNPSKFTAWGTGTYLVGTDELAIIDPGPHDPAHLDALLRAVGRRTVTHLLITHTHADHSPAAAALRDATGAPTYGFGPHPADADELTEEHGDLAFAPDHVIRDGDVIDGDGFRFECLHTPGHISNHVCYAEVLRRCVFTGDHVMGWSTTVVSPPAGRMDDYMSSLHRLAERDDLVLYPTHGPPIPEPHRYLAELIEHRLLREQEILAQLELGPAEVGDLVAAIYAEVRPELHEPAGRSVLAHLLALDTGGRVEQLTDGRWQLRNG